VRTVGDEHSVLGLVAEDVFEALAHGLAVLAAPRQIAIGHVGEAGEAGDGDVAAEAPRAEGAVGLLFLSQSLQPEFNALEEELGHFVRGGVVLGGLVSGFRRRFGLCWRRVRLSRAWLGLGEFGLRARRLACKVSRQSDEGRRERSAGCHRRSSAKRR
jgi:hypothetical protein